MKRPILMFVAVLLLFLLFAPEVLSAQEQQEAQKITVKNKEVSNGVVILDAQSGKSSFELQCNKDFLNCAALEPGEYAMVRLPKNRGPYDCANAEVHRRSAGTETGDLLGQYCLIEKK